MKTIQAALFCFFTLITYNTVLAQDSARLCLVETPSLQGKYSGECKDGYADGKGEAFGVHHYTGSFKRGWPNGKGSFYYGDTVLFTGNFQNGIREGKGEIHYLRPPQPDSIVKGYWSGDEYRGSRYITYAFTTTQMFDRYDIQPLGETDFSVTIDISTTTGSPNGSMLHSLTSPTGVGISLQDLISMTGDFIRKKTSSVSGRSATAVYEILKFPAKLLGTLSNGKTFELELYKAARWKVSLFTNQ